MLGIGQLISNLIGLIKYGFNPDNHISKNHIKYLKEIKKLTDPEIKHYYLGDTVICQIERRSLKKEFEEYQNKNHIYK